MSYSTMSYSSHDHDHIITSLSALGCRFYFDDDPRLGADEQRRAQLRTIFSDSAKRVFGMFLSEFRGQERDLLPFTKLHDLVDVTIIDSAIGRLTVEAMQSLPNLQDLNLHGSSIDSDCVPFFPRFPRLTRLVLGATSMGWANVASLAMQMPRCDVYWNGDEPSFPSGG